MTSAKEKLAQEQAEFLPLRQAMGVQTFSLFWIPARFKPMPDAQREWLVTFLRRFERAVATLKLEKLQFLHARVIRQNQAVQKEFHRKLHRYKPSTGPSRSPNQPAPVRLDRDVMKRFASNRKDPNIEPFIRETAYRFRRDIGEDFTRIFMGYGGSTILFSSDASSGPEGAMELPAIPPITVPKYLRKYGMLQTIAQDFDPGAPTRTPPWLSNHPLMQPLKNELGVNLEADHSVTKVDTFGQKSKQLFGRDIQDTPGYAGVSFVLPRLTTQDFLAETEEDVRKWFEVFEIYIRESPEDEGFVIASKHDLRPVFREVLETMREDGYVYWEQ